MIFEWILLLLLLLIPVDGLMLPSRIRFTDFTAASALPRVVWGGPPSEAISSGTPYVLNHRNSTCRTRRNELVARRSTSTHPKNRSAYTRNTWPSR